MIFNFRNWVLQTFPFLEDDFDALTDYELFCKMMEYVKKFAKDNEDFNKRLTDLENYINNLDLQDEVNTKLDEMAQDGTLENLIGQYIQLMTTYTYNNVAEMKNATNLVNGSFARTSGFYSYNDGGGAYYKIRQVTNDDIIDEMFIIELKDNLLVAELLYDKLNVKQIGAKADGTTDNTLIFNKAVEKSNNIYIPEGIYLTGEIELKSNVYITGAGIEKSILKKSNDSSYVLGQSDYNTLYNTYTVGNLTVPDNVGLFNINLSDFTIDGNNTNGNLIKLFGRYFEWHNLVVKNIKGDAILTAYGQHNDTSVTNSVKDLLESKFDFIKIMHVNGKGWVYNGAHDSYISNMIIVDTTDWAFYENTPNGLGGVWLNNCNCWEVYNGFYLKSGGRITGCQFTGYDHTITEHDTYGLYCDDSTGSISAIGCIWGGMDYGISIKGSNHYITGQFYENTKANLDLRDCFDSTFEGVFTPSANGTVFSSTSIVGAISMFGSINKADISINNMGVLPYNALMMLRTLNGQIINLPQHPITSGGWTPSFPDSNGTLLTTDSVPTQTLRGGVLRQPYGYQPTGQTATTDQLNDLIATLVTAGVLNI